MARSAKTRTDKVDPLVPTDAAGPSEPLDDGQVTPLNAVIDIMPEPEMAFELDQSAAPEPEQQPISDPVPPSQPAPTPKVAVQRVGFGPVMLGGILAAVLGYAAAYFGQSTGNPDMTALALAQADQIADLQAQIAALPAPADIAPLSATLALAQSNATDFQSETLIALTAFDARLSELEKAPSADGTLSVTAIAAWEREMEGLRAEISAQEARMQELAADATAHLDQTRSEVATIEQSATEAAVAATARAALSRVQASLESGAPFEAALGDLAAIVTVPDALTALAAKGVPTLLILQTDFPAAARAALAVARNEGLAGEDGGGFASFLRNQFDVRSVTPQDGDTADAILSRAEEGLRQNRLVDAMAEIATLSEVVRAEMSGWIGAAEARIAALAAAEQLSQSLTQN